MRYRRLLRAGLGGLAGLADLKVGTTYGLAGLKAGTTYGLADLKAGTTYWQLPRSTYRPNHTVQVSHIGPPRG